MNQRVLRYTTPLVLLLTLVSFHCVLSAEQAGTLEKTSLWRVESESTVVYLLGSIHLLKEEDFPLDQRMERALEAADKVVFEIDLDSALTPAFQQYVLSVAFYPEGKTLKTEISDSLYSLLETRLPELGLSVEQMQRFEPWFVALTAVAVRLQQLGFDPNFGVDTYFHQRAKQEKKDILALETPKYQIDLFDSMLSSEQEDVVFQTFEQMDDIESMLGEIMRYWRRGNLDSLEHTLNRSMADYPEIRDKLITRRNLNWMADLERFLNSGDKYLIVVGVGHMAGEEGLISLLAEKGYKIEPVTSFETLPKATGSSGRPPAQ